MAIEKLEQLLEQIKLLSPVDKGKLFSLFFIKEREQMKGSRKELFGSVKVEKELTEDDFKSGLYNPNLDDFLK